MKRADLSLMCLRSPNRAHVRTRPRAAGIGRDKTEAAIVGEMHYPSNHSSPINSCKWMPVLWRLSILQICLFAVWMRSAAFWIESKAVTQSRQYSGLLIQNSDPGTCLRTTALACRQAPRSSIPRRPVA
jgi:hypothetical protein